jgi:predicted transcriptional regulator
MTSSNTFFYNLNDFNNILFDDFQYKLPESVYDIIHQLSAKLGVSVNREKEGGKEKSTEYHKPRNHKRNHNSAFMSDEGKNEDSWAQLRSFKSTVMEKKTEGVEKTMNDIRSCLNKISAKNYDSKKNEIIEYINSLSEQTLSETDEIHIKNRKEIEKIANNIFEIASTNKFFSELYAELYKSLVEQFEIFQDILNSFIINFTDTMHNIQYVDPNEDYDKFCAYNKLNDIRKATVVFIVNLAKKGVLEPETLISISSKTFSILMENINQPNNINEVEEITENIFLLVTQSVSILKLQSGWTEILENIKTLSQLKVKDRPSMSSRAIFKYMDIMDKLTLSLNK